jgi:hypothetical protein
MTSRSRKRIERRIGDSGTPTEAFQNDLGVTGKEVRWSLSRQGRETRQRHFPIVYRNQDRSIRVVETRPHAPLLKRLVRYPYTQEVVRGNRVVSRESFPEPIKLGKSVPAMSQGQEARGVIYSKPLASRINRLRRVNVGNK